MKPPRFEYHAPTTVAEAVEMLASLADLDAKVIAGGQSLVPLMNLRLARPGALIDLRRIDELRAVERQDGIWSLGALTRHAQVEDSDDLRAALPVVPAVVSHIGYRAIRNRGTVGGSLCHADPAAEWPLLARLLDADLTLTGTDGTRVVPAADFFQSFFVTAAADDEVLIRVELRVPAEEWGWGFAELAHTVGDFAIAAVGAVVERADGSVSRARLATAGVGATPLRLPTAEALLTGADLHDPDVVRRAAAAAVDDIDPTADAGGSSAYKRQLVEVLVRRALSQASDVPVGVAA